ncbi:MAG: tyrosine--tRNA ligase [Paracoccaceae bacterium]|nr:tyrosine--tRNA ligase [Paracoccaceae bacterium]
MVTPVLLDFKPKSDFMNIAVERGFYYQCSHPQELDQRLFDGPLTGYIGFDCTAPSFHIGNLVQIMRLYWLQQTGHQPIALIGGATTKVGDPSGKDKSRTIMPQEQVDKNKASLKQTFHRFIDFDASENAALMVDNDDWMRDVKYIDFLREIGSKFSVNRLLSLETARERLQREQELSFIEFNYTLLQSYDFLKLRELYNCVLQMGGSDQWGNVISGVDLCRRMGFDDTFALTCPLITTSDGKKMGKTESGAIWLNADLLSPYDYWQYWRNVQDTDTARFLRLFTAVPLDEIARIETLEGAEMNDGKILLANEATAMLHGRDAADEAASAAAGVFGEQHFSEGAPQTEVTLDALKSGIRLQDFMLDVGLLPSKKEGRRLMDGNAIKVNDQPVSQYDRVLGESDLQDDTIKITKGRKQHHFIRVVN